MHYPIKVCTPCDISYAGPGCPLCEAKNEIKHLEAEVKALYQQMYLHDHDQINAAPL